MKLSAFGILLILLALFNINAQAAESLIWKTETTFAKEIEPQGKCKENDDECLQADHVGYASVSHYGRTYYLTFEEASRAYVSFDALLDDNPDVQFVFSIEQVTSGAIDWGGIENNGAFRPLYAVKRVYDPDYDWGETGVDRSKSGLIVWRLSTDKPPSPTVMLGNAGPENAKARAMAEADFAAQK
jgi:hypothetical protein